VGLWVVIRSITVLVFLEWRGFSSAELFLVLSRSEHRDLSAIMGHTVSCSILYKSPTTPRLTASLHTVYRLIVLSPHLSHRHLPHHPPFLRRRRRLAHRHSPPPPPSLIPTRHLPTLLPLNSSSPSSPAIANHHPPAIHNPPPQHGSKNQAKPSHSTTPETGSWRTLSVGFKFSRKRLDISHQCVRLLVVSRESVDSFLRGRI